MKYLNHVDLTGNELRNACLQALASDPAYKEGFIFYRSGSKVMAIGRNGVYEYNIPSGEKGAASGVASLDALAKVIQDPANAQVTGGINKIPMGNGSGKLDTTWFNMGAGSNLDADKLDSQEGTWYRDRANHTGTQLAATISDFLSTVVTARLDQFAVPTAAVALNGQKITNLGTPTADTDAATKLYVDGLAQGLDAKPSVLCATTGNMTLSAPQIIDGISAVAGSRVLVKDQTTQSQNGIYVVAAGAWTRATDFDVWTEVPSAYVFVERGTLNADCGYVCSADQGGTLNTTAITWSQFSKAGVVTASNVGLTGQAVYKQQTGTVLEFRSVAGASSKLLVALDAPNNAITVDVVEANLILGNLGGTLPISKGGTGAITAPLARTALGAVGKYAANVGDGTATSIVVTHSLGTQDVQVTLAETASPYNMVMPDVQLTSTNTITLLFTTAPTVNQYRVTVIG